MPDCQCQIGWGFPWESGNQPRGAPGNVTAQRRGVGVRLTDPQMGLASLCLSDKVKDHLLDMPSIACCY
mgnify:CR=1 FL=1